MSFALTTEQIKNRTKTVTRRFGWWNLKAGDVVCAVEKGMGLKKGEKIKRLALLRIVRVSQDHLGDITQDECIKEGFPNMSPNEFVKMIQDHYKCSDNNYMNRIEFEYI
ncbi:MAG: ASCH domain-containing protein [Spirochaetia bacterium]|nr:ASCH domain-containing protein [Spirochaetia bacterium]